MIRPPPTSPLFPYTTLFRSRPSPPHSTGTRHDPRTSRGPRGSRPRRKRNCSRRLLRPRSEEHTSELQSQSNLVCRLLLEKKNKLVMTVLSRRRNFEQCNIDS